MNGEVLGISSVVSSSFQSAYMHPDLCLSFLTQFSSESHICTVLRFEVMLFMESGHNQ